MVLPAPRSPRPSPEPPAIPEHELQRCIGWGSYGEVWLAQQTTTLVWHAVKLVYRESFDEDRPYQREFEGIIECEPISHGHEGLIDILQVGRNDAAGFFYYVMELADDRIHERHVVPGKYQARTLRSELMDKGRLHLADCLAHGQTLAHALAHLHGHGLVHRDIKPSNIVFVNGQAKLADIGLVTSMDTTYSLVGTPGYIPQEGPGQKAADIFSLGKVIYEISTGKDRHDFPLLPADATGLHYLNEILLIACARRADDRYDNAAELAADLQHVAEDRPPLSRQRKNRRLAMTLVLSVVLAVLAWVFYDRQQPSLKRGLVLEMALPGEMELSRPIPTIDHRGKNGTALFFDGEHDLAEMQLPAALGPNATLAVWVKSIRRETSSCIAGVFLENNTADSPLGMWLEAQDHGKFALRQWLHATMPDGTRDKEYMPEAVSDFALKGDGTWHLLMGVSDGGQLRLYVDGRLQRTTAKSTPLNVHDGVIRLGHDGANGAFRGGVGRMWLFNRALSETEARLLFNQHQQVDPFRGLVAHYPLNGNGEDVSGQNRPLNLQGGCLPTANRHGVPDHAMTFDGVDDWAGNMRSSVPTKREPRTFALWAWRSPSQPEDRVGLVMTGYAGMNNNFGLEYLQTAGIIQARQNLNASFEAEKWVHLAVTYDGRQTRLYVDGRSAGQVASRLNTVHWRLFLGANPLVSGPPKYFQGALDELRVYNRALTEREVAGLVQLEQPIPGMDTLSSTPPELLFPNSNFILGTFKGWRVLHNTREKDRPDGSKYVKIMANTKADGGYLAEAKEFGSGVTLFSPSIKVNPENRILLARYCKPFGVSSCGLVVLTGDGKQVALEENNDINLVERRHDLKPWLGQTIRIGFSGGWILMDYLKTLPVR